MLSKGNILYEELKTLDTLIENRALELKMLEKGTKVTDYDIPENIRVRQVELAALRNARKIQKQEMEDEWKRCKDNK